MSNSGNSKPFRRSGTVGNVINAVDFMGVVSFMNVFPAQEKKPAMVELQFSASDDVELERTVTTDKDGKKQKSDVLHFSSFKPTLTFRAEGFNVPDWCLEAIRPGNMVHLVGHLSSVLREVDDETYVPMMYVRIVDILTIREAQPERPARVKVADTWKEFSTLEEYQALCKPAETKKTSGKTSASKKAAAAVPEDDIPF